MTALTVAAYRVPLAGQQRLLTTRHAATLSCAAMALLGGSGHLDTAGLASAIGAPSAIVLILTAAPMLTRHRPNAADTSALAVPTFAVLAAATGETRTWRTPILPQAAAIVFLGLILTAINVARWMTGLRSTATSRAVITIGVILMAALTVTGIRTGTPPSSAQVAAIAIVASGLMSATATWTPRWPATLARRRLTTAGLILVTLATGCRATPPPAATPPDPAQPVREYFAALARGDTATAYQLARTASRWLVGNGLAHGYQPPTNVNIISTTFAPHGHGNLAYVRVQYQLAEAMHESAFEVWKTGGQPPQWAITSGATGRLDVISAHTPHVKIANVKVTTPLTSPRISGGNPSAGYFEVPPGVYTITTDEDRAPPGEEIHVAVPAVWRDGTPVTATIRTPPKASHAPQQAIPKSSTPNP